MSRNLKLFLVAAAVFYLIGMMNDAAALYVMAGICLAAIAGCYWLSRLAVAGLSLRLHLQRREVNAGAKVPLQFQLRNIGLISRPGPMIELPVHNRTITGLDDSYQLSLPALVSGESAGGVAEVKLPARGRWSLGPARIVGTDPLGMFRRPGPLTEDQSLLVLPEVFEVPWVWRRDLLSPAARQMAQARTRHGGEFWGIRQHEPGDDLRHVHWKVTAHRGDLVVKEYARGRELSAVVWLDLGANNVVGEGADSSLEMSITMTASLIPALLAMDQAVGLVGDGLPTALAVPGRGEATAVRALHALAEAQLSSRRLFAHLIKEQSGSARPGLTAVVVTSGVEPGLDGTILWAAARGVAMRCLLLAPAGSLTPAQKGAQDRLAVRLGRAGIPMAIGRSRQELPHTLSQLAQRNTGDKAVAI